MARARGRSAGAERRRQPCAVVRSRHDARGERGDGAGAGRVPGAAGRSRRLSRRRRRASSGSPAWKPEADHLLRHPAAVRCVLPRSGPDPGRRAVVRVLGPQFPGGALFRCFTISPAARTRAAPCPGSAWSRSSPGSPISARPSLRAAIRRTFPHGRRCHPVNDRRALTPAHLPRHRSAPRLSLRASTACSVSSVTRRRPVWTSFRSANPAWTIGALAGLVAAAVEAVAGTPARVVVNDRVDIALGGACPRCAPACRFDQCREV